MGQLLDDVIGFETRGYCSICLTPIARGDHEICRVFSGIDSDDSRSILSPSRLNQYKGSLGELAEVALYSLVTPWDIRAESARTWFVNIEELLLRIEEGKVSRSRIIEGILSSQSDMYGLRRIASDKRYPLDEYFNTWDPSYPLNPVDYFFGKIQVGRYYPDIKTQRSWTEILTDLYSKILGDVPDLDCRIPPSWTEMSVTNRRLLYCKEKDIVISVRRVAGRQLISSSFELSGQWRGWRLRSGYDITPPELNENSSPELIDTDHILTNWDKLVRSESRADDMRRIATSHGMEILGTPHRDETDVRAMKSHAEFVKPGMKGLVESLKPAKEIERASELVFSQGADVPDDELFRRASEFMKAYTRYERPTCKTQARALGWVLSQPGTVFGAVMPTGSGKSLIPLCAALNSYLRSSEPPPPLVVVVCPLISLLDDQVLTARRDANVEAFKKDNDRICSLHHLRTGETRYQAMNAIENGTCSMVFLTAEQLQKESVIRAISRRRVDWIFIDEAHGIIEFEDYRPAYSRLWSPIERLKISSPDLGVGILTATLPPDWEKDVWASLFRMSNRPRSLVFRSSSIRKNLRFDDVVVFKKGEGQSRNDSSVETAVASAEEGKRTIIYSLYLKKERYFRLMYDSLLEKLPGKTVGAFSGEGSLIGGDSVDEEDFIKAFSKGRIDVVLATMAFGLGIDRKDIETIVLNGIPSSLNVLYQQAGRAARGKREDGERYAGTIHIHTEPWQDFEHQHTLSSQNRLHATTTTRFLETMIYEEGLRPISEGIYLLDVRAQDRGYNYESSPTQAKRKNIDALRILAKVGAIELMGIFSDRIAISPKMVSLTVGWNSERFLGECKCETLEGGYLLVDTAPFLRLALGDGEKTLADCYQFVGDVLGSSALSQRDERYALVAWLWNGSKRELEEEIAIWRTKDDLRYQREETWIREFLSKKDHNGRMKVISKYYRFCGIDCSGCKDCE